MIYVENKEKFQLDVNYITDLKQVDDNPLLTLGDDKESILYYSKKYDLYVVLMGEKGDPSYIQSLLDAGISNDHIVQVGGKEMNFEQLNWYSENYVVQLNNVEDLNKYVQNKRLYVHCIDTYFEDFKGSILGVGMPDFVKDFSNFHMQKFL